MRRTALRTTIPLAAGLLVLAFSSAPAASSTELVHAAGTFDGDGPAYTYAPATLAATPEVLIPEGATAEVRVVETAAGKTVATLQVRGFPDETTYTVHAHTGPCGSNSLTSAGHYQHSVGGAVDDQNELWLGFTTNPAGNGRAQSVVDWQFRDGGANSVTFHYGGAPRVGCLPVAF